MLGKRCESNNNVIAFAAGSVVLGLLASTAGAASLATWKGGGADASWADVGNWNNADGVGTSPTQLVPGTDQDIQVGDATHNYNAVYYAVGTPSSYSFNFPSKTYTTSGGLTIAAGSSVTAFHGTSALSLDGGAGSTSTTDVVGGATGLNNAGILGVATNGASWTVNLGGKGQSAATSTNTGTIEAINGGTFYFLQPTPSMSGGIINTGGLIEAFGTASTAKSALSLTGKVTGGTVLVKNQYSTLNVTGSYAAAVFNGVTFGNAGALNVNENPAGGNANAYMVAQADSNGNASTFDNSGTAVFKFFGSRPVGVVGLAIGGTTASSDYKFLNVGTSDASTFSNEGTLTFENANTVSANNPGASTVSVEFDLNTSGAVNNNGTINFTTDGTAAYAGPSAGLRLGHGATIGGIGNLVFNNAPTNFVSTMSGVSATADPTLTLGSGQTLSGTVQLGSGLISINNHGAIHANDFDATPGDDTTRVGNQITISTYNNSFTNDGTLQVDHLSQITDADASLILSHGSGITVEIDSNHVAALVGQSGLISDALGTLDLTGGASLNVTDFDPSTTLADGTVFTLMHFAAINGEFSNYANGSIYTLNDNQYIVGYSAGDVTLTATSSPVPEPASLSLLAIGSLGLLSRRRRAIA